MVRKISNASGNSVALKSFQSFTVNDELLIKVVEALRAGEKKARTSGNITSFEVFYHGFRQNIAIGRLYLIPSKVCSSRKDFPVALLYGTIVRELNLGEEVADLIERKIGQSEFDEYADIDFQKMKDTFFKNEDGGYATLVMFAPHWSNVRDYIYFKYTEDEAKLSNLVRHLIFGAYYNPALSSAFDALMTTVDTANLDVTDITPKLTNPALVENILKEYPELNKVASGLNKKIFLTAKTADAITQELLEPAEMNVFEALDNALEGAMMPETDTPEEAAGEFNKPEGDRHDPQYGEPGSYTQMMNEDNLADNLDEKNETKFVEKKEAAGPLGNPYRAPATGPEFKSGNPCVKCNQPIKGGELTNGSASAEAHVKCPLTAPGQALPVSTQSYYASKRAKLAGKVYKSATVKVTFGTNDVFFDMEGSKYMLQGEAADKFVNEWLPIYQNLKADMEKEKQKVIDLLTRKYLGVMVKREGKKAPAVTAPATMAATAAKKQADAVKPAGVTTENGTEVAGIINEVSQGLGGIQEVTSVSGVKTADDVTVNDNEDKSNNNTVVVPPGAMGGSAAEGAAEGVAESVGAATEGIGGAVEALAPLAFLAATAKTAWGDEDEEDNYEPVYCPMCNHEGAFLGTLGRLDHFRCPSCGMDFNREHGKIAAAKKKKAADDQTAAATALHALDTFFSDRNMPTEMVEHALHTLKGTTDANLQTALKDLETAINNPDFEEALDYIDNARGKLMNYQGVAPKAASSHRVIAREILREISEDGYGRSSRAAKEAANREAHLNKYRKQAVHKMADVPLTEDSIWADITEDFGPAPMVDLPNTGSVQPTPEKGKEDTTPEKSKKEDAKEEKFVPKSEKFTEKDTPKAESKEEEHKEASWEDGQTLPNCPRPERKRCNETDPEQCCGGGAGANCDCLTCHPPTSGHGEDPMQTPAAGYHGAASKEAKSAAGSKNPWAAEIDAVGTDNGSISEAPKPEEDFTEPGISEETLQLAQKLIDDGDEICYDVAANQGQMFDNVKHMRWFVKAVAEEVAGMEKEYDNNHSEGDMEIQAAAGDSPNKAWKMRPPTGDAPKLLKERMPLVEKIKAELEANNYVQGTPEWNKAMGEAIRFHDKFGPAIFPDTRRAAFTDEDDEAVPIDGMTDLAELAELVTKEAAEEPENFKQAAPGGKPLSRPEKHEDYQGWANFTTWHVAELIDGEQGKLARSMGAHALKFRAKGNFNLDRLAQQFSHTFRKQYKETAEQWRNNELDARDERAKYEERKRNPLTEEQIAAMTVEQVGKYYADQLMGPFYEMEGGYKSEPLPVCDWHEIAAYFLDKAEEEARWDRDHNVNAPLEPEIKMSPEDAEELKRMGITGSKKPENW